MFTAALFMMIPNWKQPHVHYHSGAERNEPVKCTATQADLKNIMLGKDTRQNMSTHCKKSHLKDILEVARL